MTEVLDFCKQHQSDRVNKKLTLGNFNFTEGWFRNSGLYDLYPIKDERLTQKEIGEKIGWSKSKVNQYSALLKNITYNVLDLAKKQQKGRVSEKLTSVSF